MSAPPFLLARRGSDWIILGRATAHDATGAISPEPSEGRLLRAEDMADAPDGIRIALFDRASSTPRTALESATPSPGDVLETTLQTTAHWTLLGSGGNFLFQVPADWLENSGVPNDLDVIPEYVLGIRLETSGGTPATYQARVHVEDPLIAG